jgi:hypothetical protein
MMMILEVWGGWFLREILQSADIMFGWDSLQGLALPAYARWCAWRPSQQWRRVASFALLPWAWHAWSKRGGCSKRSSRHTSHLRLLQEQCHCPPTHPGHRLRWHQRPQFWAALHSFARRGTHGQRSKVAARIQAEAPPTHPFLGVQVDCSIVVNGGPAAAV